jgi:hypothetical protein
VDEAARETQVSFLTTSPFCFAQILIKSLSLVEVGSGTNNVYTCK